MTIEERLQVDLAKHEERLIVLQSQILAVQEKIIEHREVLDKLKVVAVGP